MANKIISPQLLYNFSRFLENRVLNIEDTRFIDPIDPTEIDHTCFIEVLFCEANDSTSVPDFGYEYPHYRYKFRSISSRLSWDKTCRDRSIVYPSTTQYYVCDGQNCRTNLFQLTQDDLTLINKLLQYKRTGSTDISSIVYNNLTTKLSKLIYIYLDFKLTGDYSKYNNTDLISDSTSVLTNMFECYVVEEMFKEVSGTS